MKNLSEWLSYLGDFYGNNSGGDLNLVKTIAAELAIKQFPVPVVTVAGTNGKGSCVAFLEEILLAAGYKVATYTSPHLLCFSERIKVNGKKVAKDQLCEALEIVADKCNQLPLSYFAIITLAALYIFQSLELEVIILEVGLGGRLDPVNIIDPAIAVITTIALDHTNRLGNSREEIGFEKAGIIRPFKPLVCGDPAPPATIVKRATELVAPLYSLGEEFSFTLEQSGWSWKSGKCYFSNLPITKLPVQNAATALMVQYLLHEKHDLNISKNAIYQGVKKASLPARMQTISSKPLIVLDVAHNGESATYLAHRLTATKWPGRTLAVIGMLKDKDIAAILQPLLKIVEEWHCGTLHQRRGATAADLANWLKNLGVELCYTHDNVADALKQTVAECGVDDRIVVFGSFYSAAEILKTEEENKSGRAT